MLVAGVRALSIKAMSMDIVDFIATIAVADDEPEFFTRLRASPPKTAIDIADFILSIPVPDLPVRGQIAQVPSHGLHSRDNICGDHIDDEMAESTNFENDDLVQSGSDVEEPETSAQPNTVTASGAPSAKAKVVPSRSSCDAMKNKAFNYPSIDLLNMMCAPCNRTCRLGANCCSKLTFQQLLHERVLLWGRKEDKAPTDKERAATLLSIIQKRSHSLTGSTEASDAVFRIDEITVCASAYARIIGLSYSADFKDAPGQYRRLISGHLSGKSTLELLAEAKVNLDRSERFTVMKGIQKGFVEYIATFFGDTLPAAKSKEGAGHVNIRVVPYRTVRDLYEEYVFQCLTGDPPIDKIEYGSYNTFNDNFAEMVNDKSVQLLGGKGSFQTCAICNHCLALKKAAAARGTSGRIIITVIRTLQRAHLKQQQIERQHCETKIGIAKKEFDANGDPSFAFIELDAQALWTTMAGKLQKDRTDPYPQIEVRNIGARVVCGPIDHYISITTSDLLPGGANIMIEATRLAIEYLADALSKLPTPLALPRSVGINYDNCGENKNRTNLAWMSHLVMSCYFDRIELFFLFAGHTHSPLDQNFSVVSKAVAHAEFIASPVAMEELFLYAHEPTDRSRVRMVIPMEYYHDYVSWYSPVMNNLVKNYAGPHRFLIERHEIWGLSILTYQWQTPLQGWADVWLPAKPPPEEDTLDNEANINLKRFDSLGGLDLMLANLGIDASEKTGDSLEAAAKLGSSESSLAEEREHRKSTMKEIARLEDGALAETNLRMEHQATAGRLPEDVSDNIEPSEDQTLAIEAEMLTKNSKTCGYISMLKLSQCADSDWLNKRPQILPNPDAWEQVEKVFELRKKNALESAAAVAAATASSTGGHREDNHDAANDKWKSRGRTRKISRTDEDKAAATAEENSAAAMYTRFKDGAAQMSKTANFFLDLEKNTRFTTVDSDDIYNATHGFTKVVFTSVDKQYYSNRNSIAAIKDLQRTIVARAAAEPWALLRLPEVTPALLKRKQEQSQLYRKVQEEAYASYSRLLSKKSHGRDPEDVHREVITRDGKEVIYARSLDDMTMEMLKSCATKAVVPGRSKMDKKKLKEALENYLKANKNVTLEMLTGDEEMPVVVAIPLQQAPPRPSSNDTTGLAATSGDASQSEAITSPSSSATATDCSIMECECSEAVVWCTQCNLWFCGALHGPHSSHSAQTHFKAGRKPASADLSASAGTSASASVIGPAADRDTDGDLTLSASAAAAPVVAAQPQAHLSLQRSKKRGSVSKLGSNLKPGRTAVVPIAAAVPTGSHGPQEPVTVATSAPKADKPVGSSALTTDVTSARNRKQDVRENLKIVASSVVAAPTGSPQEAEPAPVATSASHPERAPADISVGSSVPTTSRKRKQDASGDALADPVNDLAVLLQTIAASGRQNLYEEIKLKLNYHIYDADFLLKLAYKLNVDVSSASSVRRPTREGVMNCLISSFLSKTN